MVFEEPLIEFGLELGAEFTKVSNLEGAATEAAKLKIYGHTLEA